MSSFAHSSRVAHVLHARFVTAFGLKKRQFSESWDRKNVAASKSFADVTRPDIDRENLEKGDKLASASCRSFDEFERDAPAELLAIATFVLDELGMVDEAHRLAEAALFIASPSLHMYR